MDEKCIIDPERDCIGKAAAAKLEARIEALEEWQKDSKKFHHDFYDWQRTQIARDATLDEKLNNMDANIKKVLAKQEACELKPGKRWDAIVDKAIWAVLERPVVSSYTTAYKEKLILALWSQQITRSFSINWAV